MRCPGTESAGDAAQGNRAGSNLHLFICPPVSLVGSSPAICHFQSADQAAPGQGVNTQAGCRRSKLSMNSTAAASTTDGPAGVS